MLDQAIVSVSLLRRLQFIGKGIRQRNVCNGDLIHEAHNRASRLIQTDRDMTQGQSVAPRADHRNRPSPRAHHGGFVRDFIPRTAKNQIDIRNITRQL